MFGGLYATMLLWSGVVPELAIPIAGALVAGRGSPYLIPVGVLAAAVQTMVIDETGRATHATDQAIREAADQAGIAPRVGADGAGIDGVEIAANRTGANGARGIGQRGAQRLHQGLAFLQEMQRHAASGARTQAGQAAQKLDQPLDLGAIHLELEARRQGKAAGEDRKSVV